MEKKIFESSSNSNGNAEAIDLWDKCLVIIKDNLNWRSFQTWFEPIRAVGLMDNILTLQVPSQFFYEWLEEHYVELLGKTIKRVLGKEGRLEYKIMMESNASKNPASVNVPSSSYKSNVAEHNYIDLPLKVEDPHNIKTPYAIPGLKRIQIDPQLNSNYTFESFIEGECNRVPRNAGIRIAAKPGATSFNPLVVYGGVGCGKTHLLQAIGNEVRKNFQNKSVLYVSSEKFINQFIDHAKNGEINDFIHFYQLIDVLLMDDIHLFATTTKTQDVFFAIFNHLHQSGKQIVLTSDTAPKDLNGLQERLLSRFRWGLNAEIQTPDYETRQTILKMRMRREGLELSDEVIKYVAYNVQTNVRELEGALIALFAQSTLNNKEIDLELAKKVLKNFVKNISRELTVETIQKMVCDFYHVEYNSLLTKTRKREIVLARQITMYFAKKFTKQSLKSIGEHLGGFDHTTVIHSCQAVQNLMETDVEYKDSFLEIQQKIQFISG